MKRDRFELSKFQSNLHLLPHQYDKEDEQTEVKQHLKAVIAFSKSEHFDAAWMIFSRSVVRKSHFIHFHHSEWSLSSSDGRCRGVGDKAGAQL